MLRNPFRKRAFMSVAKYNTLERTAIAHSCNRVLECVQPELFLMTGYPTRISDDVELGRYVEVMHENKIQYIFENYLDNRITSEELALIETLARHVFEMSGALYEKPTVPTSSLLIATSIFRQIEFLFEPRKTVIFEVGGGCGYLGALLLLAGYRIISMDVTQPFYMYQSHLYRTLLGDDFIELATDHRPFSKFKSMESARAIHVPWWKYYVPESDFHMTVDVVTCNHCLGEMHPWALDFVLNTSISLLTRSKQENAGFVFQAYGSPVKRPAANTCHALYIRNYRIAHNDETISAYVRNLSTEQKLCPLPPEELAYKGVDAFQPPIYANEENPQSRTIINGRKKLTNSPGINLEDTLNALRKIAGKHDLRTDDEKFLDGLGVNLA